ncbi:allantoinase AllB [Alkalicoccus chagannorensis]|uniref:allantoinase AllB n=1 Tax=Alkalicoccus chagannorensis TaxID=427072 RepID=UPI000412C075|nr:allantoinase AllB [Alkalicoccus chagannorensis]
MQKVLQHIQLFYEGSWQERDIVMQGERIASIEAAGTAEGDVIEDGRGKTAVPGLIDVHVHINEPGRTDWEGMTTGTRALAAGGVTTLFDMPLNSKPPTATASRVEEKRAIAAEKSLIRTHWWGALMPGHLADLEAMHEAGVIGFKAFMSRAGTPDFEHAEDETLLYGMEKIAALGSRLAVHAESDMLIHWLTKRAAEAGKTSMHEYEQTRPKAAEVEAVRRILLYAEWTGCPVHICHVSCGDAVNVIAEAKARGVNVTAETCAHYLYFTLDDAARIGPTAKCAPPLRDAAEREHLWQALQNGVLDLVSSDHSPAPFSLKEGTVLESWGGIAGAQQTIDVLLTEGVHRRGLPLEEVISWVTSKPAACFDLDGGRLEPGGPADITLLDLEEAWTLKEDDLFQRHKETPYIGASFQGRVSSVYCRGEQVYDLTFSHGGER